MLSAAAGIEGLQVMVREDHAYGWQPTAFRGLEIRSVAKRRVEQIAQILRNQYDLAR
jgi:hypothetical protein